MPCVARPPADAAAPGSRARRRSGRARAAAPAARRRSGCATSSASMRATSGARASPRRAVQGGHQPARRRGEHAHAGVARPRRVEQARAAAVARAVVDGDHLVVGEGLGGERVEAAGSVARASRTGSRTETRGVIGRLSRGAARSRAPRASAVVRASGPRPRRTGRPRPAASPRAGARRISACQPLSVAHRLAGSRRPSPRGARVEWMPCAGPQAARRLRGASRAHQAIDHALGLAVGGRNRNSTP